MRKANDLLAAALCLPAYAVTLVIAVPVLLLLFALLPEPHHD